MTRTFGTLADGRAATAATLAWPGGISVEVLDYGATVRRLTVPTPAGPVETVLGFATLAGYEADRSYQGVVIGRCANRIDRALIEIDGRDYRVTANEGETCLHGGIPGFDGRLWRFEAVGERKAVLSYTSPDGEEGFPGNVTARVAFALPDPTCLLISYEATTDAACPVNLTHHLYFNLSGDHRRPVTDHLMSIAAEAVTPVRPDLIPTGEIAPVAGTPFDLRTPTRLGDGLAQAHPQVALAGGYDHNWVLEPRATPALTLRSPETGLGLQIETDQPGMQVYSGQGLAEPFAPFSGIALEPQGFPNAVNEPGFPDVVLGPGQVYRRRVLYRFGLG